MIFNTWDTELTRSSTVPYGYTFKRGYALLLGNRAYIIINIGSGGGYDITTESSVPPAFVTSTQDIKLFDYRESSSNYYLSVDPYVKVIDKNSSYSIGVLRQITVGVIRIV